MADFKQTRESLEQSLLALESQKAVLGDAIEPAIQALQKQLDSLSAAAETEDQRKQITVLFADVKGFTAMSQEMDPEDVADVMNQLWKSVDHVITDQGGRVDKHIGDAVMALFGAPIARENDPERAVLAALEMQKLIADFVDRGGLETASLQMRIGINTGLAMLGKVGSNEEYTAIGHTVNLASRLEGLADPGGILMSQSTMNEVVGLFDVEATKSLEVKGVDHPVVAYRVKQAKPRTFRVGPREVAGVQTRVVGREEETAFLQIILPQAPSDSPSDLKLVTLLGEPGVGKSRIVYEYFTFLESLPHPTWLFRGRAVESSKDLPYSVLRSILLDRFLIADSDDPGDAKKKLEEGLSEYLGERGAEVAPFLGHLIGLDYRDHPSVAGLMDESQLIRDKAFRAMVELLEIGRPEAYRVFLIEDIHWADQESLDFIQYLTKHTPEMPMLILCTARPLLAQVRPGWMTDSDRCTIVRLERLDEEATGRLIDDVLQRVDSVPKKVRELIVERSEGNPFYVEELVKMLIDRGVIDASGSSWEVRVEALDPNEIPGTLTGVLQARLDALSRQERRVLQRSSVVGRVFWEEAVDHLAEATSPDQNFEKLEPMVEALKQHELAYQRDPSAFGFTREFIFKHAMLHDVAYESVVRRARRVYHHQVATWLIGAAGSRCEEFASQIAEHYDRAEDASEAITWFLRAGDRARQTHAPESAERAYRRAIDLAAKSGADAISAARISAMAGLGEVLTMQAHYQRAIEVYEQLRETAAREEDWTAVARAEHGIATAETYRGRQREALESSIRAREFAARADDRKREAQSMFIEAWSHIRLGSFQEGATVADEMLLLSREVGDKFVLAESLNLQGVIAASTGDYGRAISHFSEAADLYREAGNEEKLMPILNNLGVIAELRGDYSSAEAKYREALGRAKDASDRDGQLVYSSNLGGALVAQGRAEEGVPLLRSVIDRSGESSLLSEANRFLARAMLILGEVEEALEAGHQALELAYSTEAHDDIAGGWRVLGVVSSVSGRPVSIKVESVAGQFSADELFARSVEIAESVESDSDVAKAKAEWALHAYRTGDIAAGDERWAVAREIYDGLGAQLEITRVEALLNTALTESDEPLSSDAGI